LFRSNEKDQGNVLHGDINKDENVEFHDQAVSTPKRSIVNQPNSQIDETQLAYVDNEVDVESAMKLGIDFSQESNVFTPESNKFSAQGSPFLSVNRDFSNEMESEAAGVNDENATSTTAAAIPFDVLQSHDVSPKQIVGFER
jgi:hypothetical protein